MQHPNRNRINLLCQNHFASQLIYQCLAAICILTLLLTVIICMPLALALPVGLATGRSFWSEESVAITSWIASAFGYAVATSLTATILACFARVWMQSTFGRPFAEQTLTLDLPAIEALKMVRREIRQDNIAKSMEVDAQYGRIIALITKSKNFRTYVDISFVEEDEERCTVLIQSASEPGDRIAAFSAFFNDLGESHRACERISEIMLPVTARRRKPRHTKRKASDFSNVADMSQVNPEEVVPPPALKLAARI